MNPKEEGVVTAEGSPGPWKPPRSAEEIDAWQDAEAKAILAEIGASDAETAINSDASHDDLLRTLIALDDLNVKAWHEREARHYNDNILPAELARGDAWARGDEDAVREADSAAIDAMLTDLEAPCHCGGAWFAEGPWGYWFVLTGRQRLLPPPGDPLVLTRTKSGRWRADSR
jgi:hypothetical protein